MKGTEKQIAWAHDIQKKAVSALNYGINTFSNKADFVAMCEQVKRAIETVEYAGDLISVYRDVNRDNDESNLKLICAIVRNRFGIEYENRAQYALIGK